MSILGPARRFAVTACIFSALAIAAVLGVAAADEAAIPFTLTDHNNIAVRALLNRTDPLTLMLHTAASDLTLTEEAVARLRSVKFGGTSSQQSWGGRGDSRFATKNRLEIGPLARDGVVVWEDKNSGQQTDGKFGLDFFKAPVVELDYDHSRIVAHDRLPAKAARYARMKLENSDGELFLTASCVIAGETYATKFLIHSGYAGSVLLDDAFAARSGIGGKIEITGETALKDSFDHTIKVKKGILPKFKIGPFALNRVNVGFFEGTLGQQKLSVIGGEVLKEFNLIIDKEHNDLYLERRHH